MQTILQIFKFISSWIKNIVQDFLLNSKPQLDFALEVLFVGMADFYCQQDGPAKGLAETFTILNFADQEKGAKLWNYTYEQAYDRLHLILDWSQKYPEILDANGAKNFY